MDQIISLNVNHLIKNKQFFINFQMKFKSQKNHIFYTNTKITNEQNIKLIHDIFWIFTSQYECDISPVSLIYNDGNQKNIYKNISIYELEKHKELFNLRQSPHTDFINILSDISQIEKNNIVYLFTEIIDLQKYQNQIEKIKKNIKCYLIIIILSQPNINLIQKTNFIPKIDLLNNISNHIINSLDVHQILEYINQIYYENTVYGENLQLKLYQSHHTQIINLANKITKNINKKEKLNDNFILSEPIKYMITFSSIDNNNNVIMDELIIEQ